MDQERFDRPSRVLALAAPTFLSRRGALAMLGTAVLGMLVGPYAEPTQAKPKSKSRHHSNRKSRRRTESKTGHHAESNDPNGSARRVAAKRKKHGRKPAQKRGQNHGQEPQGGGATMPPPDETGGGGCTSQPTSLTCAGTCGMITDNCGREVDCGQCSDPVCPSPPLTTTCNGRCGLVSDSCGRQVDCGNSCPGVETCGGGGVSNICGCTSDGPQVTCGGRCGAVMDNCDREVDCGPCGCASQDPATTCAGKCGVVQDNCGREVSCGNTCPGVETCGGGGTANTCGCTSQPRSVTCNGKCSMETDNCGREVDCGTCSGGGCFVGGTRVRMADGSDKPIELVEPDDRVLGRGGKINRVRAVLYPVLGDRQLYALNGGTAFVTASHPFLTTDGWKAVDPDAARVEVPGLDIERLTAGDVLLSVTSSEPAGRDTERNTEDRAADVQVQVQEHEIPLQSLEGRPADAATQLYNLDVDGDDTYVANGLIVHNKFF